MKEVKLPSGAVLKISPAPFADAKALYQAILRELRSVPILAKREYGDLYKEVFCAGFSSPEIDRCLVPCLQRCLYNDGSKELKIDDDTFEPVKAREDYIQVCLSVAEENIRPFAKSLYAEYQRHLAGMEKESRA